MLITDSDLQYISRFCVSLQYVNLKGCTSLTDVGIASLLRRCIKLHSLLVCDTSFGINSVLALCSSSSNHIAVEQIENELLDSLALNLQILHMGSCKCECHFPCYSCFRILWFEDLFSWTFSFLPTSKMMPKGMNKVINTCFLFVFLLTGRNARVLYRAPFIHIVHSKIYE